MILKSKKTSNDNFFISVFIVLFHSNLINKNISVSSSSLVPFRKFSEVVRFYFKVSGFGRKNLSRKVFDLYFFILRINSIVDGFQKDKIFSTLHPYLYAVEPTIIYEDNHLLVINKPPGLVVHPGSGNWTGTLMNALLHHLPSIADIPRAGIVHRLDKDTSGLLVVAKTLEAQTNLVRQLQARTVKRQYLALAAGVIRRDSGVEAPIGRHPVNRIKMAIIPENRGGKPALTWYRRLELFNYCTLLECALETGRTHQIRVHMASIGHALVGDQVYGKHDPRLPVFHRQALHATRLGLMHPLSGRQVQWEVPMPQDMRELLDTLRYG